MTSPIDDRMWVRIDSRVGVLAGAAGLNIQTINVSQPAAPWTSPGSVLVVDGVEWMVERLESQCGRVLLFDNGGNRMPMTIRFLVNHPRGRR